MSWFYGQLHKNSKPEAARPVTSAAKFGDEWTKWKVAHNVTFNDAEEEESRKKIFESKAEWVAKRNSELENTGASFRVGLNILAGLTDDESETVTGGFVPLPEEEIQAAVKRSKTALRRSFNGAARAANDGITTVLGSDSLPVSVDWRKYGAVTDIKSQGRCGACWAFAATGAMEGLMRIQHGKLISLSESQLLECDEDEFQKACQGGNFYYSFKYLSQAAVSTAKQYPYGYTFREGLADSCKIGRSNIVGVVRGQAGDNVLSIEGTEQALKKAVSIQPVAAAIHGYSQDFKNYKGGVLYSESCTGAVDHAVLVVGYGTTLDGEDFWLLRNQWGQGWGDGGYIKIARNVPLDKFPKGMCSILTQLNVPKSADCAQTDCSVYQSEEFCTTQVGCINASDSFNDEEWLVPNSTFRMIGSSHTDTSASVTLLIVFSFLGVLGFGLAFFSYRRSVRTAALAKSNQDNQNQEPAVNSSVPSMLPPPGSANALSSPVATRHDSSRFKSVILSTITSYIFGAGDKSSTGQTLAVSEMREDELYAANIRQRDSFEESMDQVVSTDSKRGRSKSKSQKHNSDLHRKEESERDRDRSRRDRSRSKQDYENVETSVHRGRDRSRSKQSKHRNERDDEVDDRVRDPAKGKKDGRDPSRSKSEHRERSRSKHNPKDRGEDGDRRDRKKKNVNDDGSFSRKSIHALNLSREEVCGNEHMDLRINHVRSAEQRKKGS